MPRLWLSAQPLLSLATEAKRSASSFLRMTRLRSSSARRRLLFARFSVPPPNMSLARVKSRVNTPCLVTWLLAPPRSVSPYRNALGPRSSSTRSVTNESIGEYQIQPLRRAKLLRTPRKMS
jgi:hypothetical protein